MYDAEDIIGNRQNGLIVNDTMRQGLRPRIYIQQRKK